MVFVKSGDKQLECTPQRALLVACSCTLNPVLWEERYERGSMAQCGHPPIAQAVDRPDWLGRPGAP